MAKLEGQTGLVLASSSGQLGIDGNVWIDYTGFTVSVKKFGSLDDGGVTLQALYSFVMKNWKDNGFEMYFFPIESIGPNEFEIRNGWDFGDDETRYLLRDAGWKLLDPTNSTTYEEWMGIQSLGSIDNAADQLYYVHSADGTPTAFELPGAVNQAVQIYGDAAHGDFDYRLTSNSEFSVFLREQGKTYASYNMNVALVKTSLTNLLYSVVIANAPDLDIEETDINIENNLPYTGMSITWGAVTRDIGGQSRNFGIVIDGNGGTLQEIYEFVQHQLREAGDIDDGGGTKTGKISDDMLVFVGPVLKTKLTSDGGVYIDNFQVADTNSLVFTDDLGIGRTFPYVGAGKIFFNDNIRADGANVNFWLYYVDAGGNLFNTPGAIIVKDNDGIDIKGAVNGAAFIAFTFDYEGNVQGGRTPNQDANVYLITIGSVESQPVLAAATLTRSTLMSFTATAAKQRNYVA